MRVSHTGQNGIKRQARQGCKQAHHQKDNFIV